MIQVTETAAIKITELMKKEGKDNNKNGLRITVMPGGCAGYVYDMKFDMPNSKDDEIVKQNGVMIITDKLSINFFKGSKVDYVEGLQGSGFKIDNPNVHSSCHCGKSVA